MATNFRIAVSITLLASILFSGCTKRSEYDECILENLKGVSSDAATRAVEAACKRGDSQVVMPNPTDDLCSVYWDGWKIRAGAKPDQSYRTFLMSRYGKETLELHIPKPMATELGLDGDAPLGNQSAWPAEFSRFFNDSLPTIESICSQ